MFTKTSLLSHLIPDRKRITGYSIQTLKRIKPAYFREDMNTLFKLLAQGKIKPSIAAQFRLEETVYAHEMLAEGVRGKIVLRCNTQTDMAPYRAQAAFAEVPNT